MWQLLIFILLIVGVGWWLSRKDKPTVFEPPPTLSETTTTSKKECSSCDLGGWKKARAKFNLEKEAPAKIVSQQSPEVEKQTDANWFKDSGKGVLSPGVQPVFGLQRAWTDAPVRACGRVTVPYRTNGCSKYVTQLAQLYYQPEIKTY